MDDVLQQVTMQMDCKGTGEVKPSDESQQTAAKLKHMPGYRCS